ncbi:nicotinate-nucleotide adenylyltransferase [Halomonas sp. HNIBRBA4712]|uniref:nicotinate-nucleotide adenylyltransferase n=1 Tax=Halomonas sp. HNIBRBA4712 TaxID=3373087 RepID=UPI003744EC0A
MSGVDLAASSLNKQPVKIAMLGGTFDPVHLGHLRSALEVSEALGLDRLHMVAAPRPPLRGEPTVAPEERFALLKAGVGDTPHLIADDRELKRAGPSYSVDTLAELRNEYGPSARLCMVIGFDTFLRLAEWREPERLFELAHLVVIARPGFEQPRYKALEELVGQREVDTVAELMAAPAGRFLSLSLDTRIAISATEVRARLGEGKSVRYLLPEAVEAQIFARGLYQSR